MYLHLFRLLLKTCSRNMRKKLWKGSRMFVKQYVMSLYTC